MHIDEVLVPGAHGFEVVLLEAEQQRFSDLDEAVLVDEYLLGSEALVRGAVAVEHVEGSAAAVEDAPKVVLLKVVPVLAAGSLPALALQIIEGVLEHEVHLVVDGADEILLLLLNLDEGKDVVVFQLGPALEERLQAVQISL